jgi:hypothetical protein
MMAEVTLLEVECAARTFTTRWAGEFSNSRTSSWSFFADAFATNLSETAFISPNSTSVSHGAHVIGTASGRNQGLLRGLGADEPSLVPGRRARVGITLRTMERRSARLKSIHVNPSLRD